MDGGRGERRRILRCARTRGDCGRPAANPGTLRRRVGNGRARAGVGAADVCLGLDRRCDARRLRGRARPITTAGRLMPATLRSILVTPNLLGKDGVSTLSREVMRALPAPCLVLSLHDATTAAAGLLSGVELRGAQGSRAAFLVDVARAMPRVTPETVIVCSHLHVAPAAKLLAWRGQRATTILCGIEAWVSLRAAERWAIAGGETVAISQHTVDRFRAANPALSSTDVIVCHPGLPSRTGLDPRAPSPEPRVPSPETRAPSPVPRARSPGRRDP